MIQIAYQRVYQRPSKHGLEAYFQAMSLHTSVWNSLVVIQNWHTFDSQSVILLGISFPKRVLRLRGTRKAHGLRGKKRHE